MRKFLSVIAFAIVAAALILGGILILTQIKDIPEGVDLIKVYGLHLGLGIGLLGTGVGAGIGCLASFFTAKTKDKE